MKTVVIGGGWSGLAAAITLCQQGKQVHLVESAKQLGGRARNVSWNGIQVDNGQHLMIGAYQHMLSMMETIGVETTDAFDRKSIDISVYDKQYPSLRLSANHWLPWPLSLGWSIIKSAGIKAFLAIARLQRSIPKTLNKSDITVSEWLTQTKQPSQLIRQLWEPLCLATLNTPIDEASAHLLATVIRDSLGQGQQAADLLIPKQPLGDLFPAIAADYIKQQGGEISLQSRVSKLIIENNVVKGVLVNDELIAADNIIIATAPSATQQLVNDVIPSPPVKQYPIITVYLQFSADFKLGHAMLGMSGTLTQWVFDRSEQQPGLIAIVISGPGQHEKMTNDELIEQVVKELRTSELINNDSPIDQLVIREKRATFAAIKGCAAARPNPQTTVKGLWLAGDHIHNDYPATLEGAIINGKTSAQLMLNRS